VSLDRFEIERKLGRVLSREFQSELDKLMGYLGDPPDLNNVPRSYWQNGWKRIQNQVEPILVDTFVQSALELPLVGITIDWDLINADAVNWARTSLVPTLQKMFDKTYVGVNELVPRYFEEQWTVHDLAQRLERFYSPVRAEMIAVTETTRSVVEGEKAAVDRLADVTGRRMVPVWLTMNDERVCPICGPRHKQMITDGMYPPAHPRCRCQVAYEYPKEAV
jgi:hypothetical protein